MLNRHRLPTLITAEKINIRAPYRLQCLRDYVAAWNREGSGFQTQLASWRDARKHCRGLRLDYPLTAGNWGQEGIGARPFYSQEFPLELVGDATDTNREMNGRRDATGYYTDNYQNGTAVPCVLSYRIPRAMAKGGPRLRFVPGVRFTEAENVTTYPTDTHYTTADAMRAAHYYAERIAEEEREGHAQSQAEIDIEDARDAIKSARASVASYMADLRKAGKLPPAVCEAVRKAIALERENVAEAIQTIRARRADFWSAVQQ